MPTTPLPASAATVSDERLAGHTVSAVRLFDVTTRYPRTVGRNAFLGSHGSGPVDRAVAITTDQGAVGWGLLAAPVEHPESIVGRPLADLIDPASGVRDDSVIWADLALHDLAGIVLGVPVHALLGAAGQTTTPIYDGSIYFDDLDPEDTPKGIDVVLANVQDGWDEGHRSFKLKIGRGHKWMESAAGIERDIEVTKAVHERFPEARLLVDGNDGFTLDGLLHFLEGVGDVPLFWIEEPFTEERGALEELHRWLDERGKATFVADGEYRPVVPEVLELAEDGLIDVLLMDVIGYGFTAWRRLLGDLSGSEQLVSPHAWGMPLKSLYASHLAAGYTGVVAIEGVRGTVDGVDLSGYRLEAGELTVSSAPGFGLPLPDGL